MVFERGFMVRIALGMFMLLIGLACNIGASGPQAPGSPIVVSTESFLDADQVWENAIEAASDGRLNVTFTEIHLTSIVSDILSQSDPPPLQDPQVFLREGQLQIYGTASQGPIEAQVLIKVEPWADAEGRLQFDIVSIDVGPVPAPEAFSEGLSTLINQAFLSSIGPLVNDIFIESLTIQNAELTIHGTVR